MLIADCIPDISPHAFTIGTFDGVHRGHQALFQELKATGKPTAVLTFAAHPRKILNPGSEPLLITPLPLKLTLLKEQGISLTIAIPFSLKLASTPFQQLLKQLPLSHLILGKDSTFGHKREGTEENVRAWCQEKKIPVEYVMKTIPVSSQKVRDAIAVGDLALAESLLGRPHLLYVPPHTACVSVTGLAMPPDGHYSFSPRAEPKAVGHTFAREIPSRFRSPKCTGILQSGSIQLSTCFPEPTILAFNLDFVHFLASRSEGGAR